MNYYFKTFINQSQYIINNSKYYLFLYIGVSLFILLPFIVFGIYKGVDLTQHVHFSTTFYNSFLEGNFYPGWAADENLGYGSIGIRFYPPLTPFLFALLRILFGDWHSATWITFLVFMVVGAMGVYLWAKEFCPDSRAFWAGIIFIFIPYHIYQIQNASQFAEFAGCSIIPFSFLYVTKICRRGNFADVIGLSISFALLILTHLPTTIIGSICLVIYSLLLINKDRKFSTLPKLITSVSLALLASSTYWIKVVTEMSLLRMTKFRDDNDFDYFFNFLLTSPWFDKRHLWFINLIFLTMLIGSLTILIINLVEKNDKNRKYSFCVFALTSFSFFMCLYPSKFIWETIPFLPEVQFPWRWLTIISVLIPIIFVMSIDSIISLLGRNKYWNNILKGIGVLMFTGLITIYGLFWIEFQLNHISKQSYDSWVSETSAQMGCDCLWTIYAKDDAFSINEKILSDNRKNNLIVWQTHRKSLFVEAGNSATNIRLATLYYPLWKAKVNNINTNLKMDKNGVILIPITDKASLIEVWFEESSLIITSKYIALSIWILFLFFIITSLIKNKYFFAIKSL